MEKAKSPDSTKGPFGILKVTGMTAKKMQRILSLFVLEPVSLIPALSLSSCWSSWKGEVSAALQNGDWDLQSFAFPLQKSTCNSHPVEGKAVLKHLEKVDCSDHSEDDPELSIFLSWKLLLPEGNYFWELNGSDVFWVLVCAKSGEDINPHIGVSGEWENISISC